MSVDGKTIFRTALLLESAANIASIPPAILAPEWCISKLSSNAALITSTTKGLTQWMGAMVVMATAPLLLSYPEPNAGESASRVTARRRLAYMTLGAGEVALAGISISQYLAGASGFSDGTLLTVIGAMGAFLSMRGFFLFVRPEWMQPRESGKKTK